MKVSDVLASNPLYLSVIAGLLFVLAISIAFLIKASRRSVELGLDKEKISGVMKSSIIFSIVPSLAIVIALFSLIPVFGVPWSWFRLSVVGSLTYELMAGELAVSSAGFESLSAFTSSTNIEMVTTVMMVMSISIISGNLFNLIFGKKLQSSMLDYRSGNDEWGTLSMSYFTLAIAIIFLPLQAMASPVHLATLISSGIIAFAQLFIIKKFKINWLSEFVLANTLVLGMVSSVFWHNLIL